LLTSVAILLREKRAVATLRENFSGFLVRGKIGRVLSDAEVFGDAEQCVSFYLAKISGFAK
jgi:hypothetical protein